MCCIMLRPNLHCPLFISLLYIRVTNGVDDTGSRFQRFKSFWNLCLQIETTRKCQILHLQPGCPLLNINTYTKISKHTTMYLSLPLYIICFFLNLIFPRHMSVHCFLLHMHGHVLSSLSWRKKKKEERKRVIGKQEKV